MSFFWTSKFSTREYICTLALKCIVVIYYIVHKEPSNSSFSCQHQTNTIACLGLFSSRPGTEYWIFTMIPIHNHSPQVVLNCHKYYPANTKYG